MGTKTNPIYRPRIIRVGQCIMRGKSEYEHAHRLSRYPRCRRRRNNGASQHHHGRSNLSAVPNPKHTETNNAAIVQSGLQRLVRRGLLPLRQVLLLVVQSPVQRLGDGVFSSISPLARCVGPSYLSICILIHRNCPSGIKRREWIIWGPY